MSHTVCTWVEFPWLLLMQVTMESWRCPKEGVVDLEVPGLVDAVGDSVESCHLCRTALLRDNRTQAH